MQHIPTRSGRHTGIVCFAGSRNGTVQKNVSGGLVSSFTGLGYRFLVGCAPGIDRCFRTSLAASPAAARRSTVHCAFPSRLRPVRQEGLRAVCLVSGAPSAATALHRRTVTMVSQCSLLVLFPDNPATGAWGRGSRLAFNTAVQQHKPVFVVTAIPPLATGQFRVTAVSLFGVVSGFWVLPSGVALREAEVFHAQR